MSTKIWHPVLEWSRQTFYLQSHVYSITLFSTEAEFPFPSTLNQYGSKRVQGDSPVLQPNVWYQKVQIQICSWTGESPPCPLVLGLNWSYLAEHQSLVEFNCCVPKSLNKKLRKINKRKQCGSKQPCTLPPKCVMVCQFAFDDANVDTAQGFRFSSATWEVPHCP